MAGFHERTHRLPGFNIFQCFKVLSGFRRLPRLRNPWKLICSITDALHALNNLFVIHRIRKDPPLSLDRPPPIVIHAKRTNHLLPCHTLPPLWYTHTKTTTSTHENVHPLHTYAPWSALPSRHNHLGDHHYRICWGFCSTLRECEGGWDACRRRWAQVSERSTLTPFELVAAFPLCRHMSSTRPTSHLPSLNTPLFLLSWKHVMGVGHIYTSNHFQWSSIL